MSFTDTTVDQFIEKIDWDGSHIYDIPQKKAIIDLREVFSLTPDVAYCRLEAIAKRIYVTIEQLIEWTDTAFQSISELEKTKELDAGDFEGSIDLPFVDSLTFSGNEVDRSFWVLYAKYRDIDPMIIRKWYELSSTRTGYGVGVMNFDCCV